MEVFARTLSLEDVDSILIMERAQLESMDEFGAKMLEWDARWREEQLKHYIPQGWSFGLWNKESQKLEAYFLAKVIPYYRSYAQVLWVERFFSREEAFSDQLIEILYRFGREKHLQQIYFEDLRLPESLNQKYKIQNFQIDIQNISLGK